jgi:hypothetical protein
MSGGIWKCCFSAEGHALFDVMGATSVHPKLWKKELVQTFNVHCLVFFNDRPTIAAQTSFPWLAKGFYQPAHAAHVLTLNSWNLHTKC